MSNPDTDTPGEYASPACLAHEVDPDYMGLSIKPAINPAVEPTIKPSPGPGEQTGSGLVAALRRFLARW